MLSVIQRMIQRMTAHDTHASLLVGCMCMHDAGRHRACRLGVRGPACAGLHRHGAAQVAQVWCHAVAGYEACGDQNRVTVGSRGQAQGCCPAGWSSMLAWLARCVVPTGTSKAVLVVMVVCCV